MREHTHPGAIFTSTAFRSGLFAGLRSNPTSTTTNPSADLNVEHPLLRRQQSSERPHQTSGSRISRVHLLRSDRNRSGHMTHVHVHYSHPHGTFKALGRLRNIFVGTLFPIDVLSCFSVWANRETFLVGTLFPIDVFCHVSQYGQTERHFGRNIVSYQCFIMFPN